MKQKKKTYKFYTVSVKIFSNEIKKPYRDILKSIHKSKFAVPQREDKAIMIRTLNEAFVEIDGHTVEYFYGKITRFTVLNSNGWINTNTLEMDQHETPEGLHPNAKEIDYIFIPDAHRFIFIKSNSFSINVLKHFIEKSFNDKKSDLQQIEVDIEISRNFFDEIFNARAVKKIEIGVSYTNADTGYESAEALDDELKASNIGDLGLSISSDSTGTINIKNSPLVKSALDLAKENGHVSASIIDNNGDKKTIKTDDYPKISQVISKEDNFINDIARHIWKRFRTDERRK